MNEAKIRLSGKEAELVLNAEFILTKNAILQKAKNLLEGIMETQQDILKTDPFIPIEIKSFAPKISKGENYQGLPYLILDHPRYFHLPDIFTIRTFFWWGNFFSTTLQLSGEYKKRYAPAIIHSFEELQMKEYWCCVNEDPWQHHFEKENYAALKDLGADNFKKNIDGNTFIKLAKKHSLHDWDRAGQLLLDDFKMLLKIIR